MRNSRWLGAALAAIASLSASAGNLVVNGSFEKPEQATGGYTLFASGSSFPGWRVFGAPGNVAPISGSYRSGALTFVSQDGAQWLDMTGLTNSATGIEQTMPTVAGTTYDLSFYVGNVVGGGWGSSSNVEVQVDGRSIGQFTNNGGAGLNTQVWRRFSQPITATGTATTIAFINRDPGNDNSNGLDNVSLTELGRGVAHAGCTQPTEAKKKPGRFAALAALAASVVAVKQGIQGVGDAGAAGQQVLNTVGQVAAASGEPGGSAAAIADCISGTSAAQIAAVSNQVVSGSPLEAVTAGIPAPGSRVRRESTSPAALRLAAATTPAATAAAPASAAPRTSPDVIGLHAGMTPEEAFAALQRRYPKAKVDTATYKMYLSPTEKPQLNTFSVGYSGLNPDPERVIVGFTPPPSKPQVWLVQRYLTKQNISRANAIGSLREKYGKETVALTNDGGSNDNITDVNRFGTMWWLFDEQGHPVAAPNSTDIRSTLNNCAAKFDEFKGKPNASVFSPSNIVRFDGRTVGGIDENWCNSRIVAVSANIEGDANIVWTLEVEVVHLPLVTGAARAEIAMLKGISQGQQQKELDAAKRNKPAL